MEPIRGIHHVTALCGDPQGNVDFYAGLLGLSLVKVTVNYDDPGTYHLYYGDAAATPGSILTFFPWPSGAGGRAGAGQVGATAFAVPPGAHGFWKARLEKAGTPVAFQERLGERALCFEDPDGMRLEIIEARWATAPVAGPLSQEAAIRGFHSVTLWLDGRERSARVLEDTLGLRPAGSENDQCRYLFEGAGEQRIDLSCQPGRPRGRPGRGTVHHVALRAPSQEGHAAWRERLRASGLSATPVIDRTYFRSVYFREPGGVLIELATDGPGFAIDEPAGSLGTSLKLPAWLEASRGSIAAKLPTFETPEGRWFP
jgi:glyoxalase family protein